MKKSVVVAIGIVYIIAIVVLGLFGQKLHVYDPIVYANSVVCHSENYKEYPEDQKDNKNADGFILYSKFTKGMKVELKCQALPNDATNRDLIYIYDAQKYNEDIVTFKKNSDYTASFTFHQAATFTVIVKSADSKGARLRIKIIINDFGSIL